MYKLWLVAHVHGVKKISHRIYISFCFVAVREESLHHNRSFDVPSFSPHADITHIKYMYVYKYIYVLRGGETPAEGQNSAAHGTPRIYIFASENTSLTAREFDNTISLLRWTLVRDVNAPSHGSLRCTVIHLNIYIYIIHIHI